MEHKCQSFRLTRCARVNTAHSLPAQNREITAGNSSMISVDELLTNQENWCSILVCTISHYPSRADINTCPIPACPSPPWVMQHMLNLCTCPFCVPSCVLENGGISECYTGLFQPRTISSRNENEVDEILFIKNLVFRNYKQLVILADLAFLCFSFISLVLILTHQFLQ